MVGENNRIASFFCPSPPRFPKSLFPSHLVIIADTPKDFTPRWTLQRDVVLGPSSAREKDPTETLPCLPPLLQGLGSPCALGSGQVSGLLHQLKRSCRAEQTQGSHSTEAGSFTAESSPGKPELVPSSVRSWPELSPTMLLLFYILIKRYFKSFS